MEPKKKDENAKDQKRQVPVDVPGVKPKEYVEAGEGAVSSPSEDTLAGFDDTRSPGKGNAKVE